MIEKETSAKMVSYEELRNEAMEKMGSDDFIESGIGRWREVFGKELFPSKLTYSTRGGNSCLLKIDWDDRSVSERLVWLGIARYQGVSLEYVMKMEGVTSVVRVGDVNRVIEMWLGGCFTGEDLDETARYLFLKNERRAVAGRDCDEYLCDLDTENLEIEELSISFPA